MIAGGSVLKNFSSSGTSKDFGSDTVDVSMETLASFWAHDPEDLHDLNDRRRELSGAAWDSPPSGLMWTQQLSPHLQRNKQLQDTLLQREEELARLQEENIKLREFLSSSFVRNLQQKAKNLATDGRTPLKRNLKHVNNKSFQDWSHRPLAYKQISKRVCRNLTTVFCSESSDTSNCSEPNLDLWVLRMLGLKDRDTIDTSSDSPSDYNLRDLVYDAASTPFLSPEYTPNSSLDSQLATSTASSAHSYCQRLTHETDDGNTYTGCNNHATSTENCTGTLEDFTAVGLMRSHESHEAVIGSYDTSTAFQSNRPEICSIAASSGVETQQGNYSEQPSYWCPLSDSQTPAEPDFFSPMLSSSPLENQSWMSAGGHSPTTQSASSQLPATPQTPRRQTDLAFSMFLSPSSSVKTHSFPQGQAFIRRDPGGRWNFTWLPTQEP